MGNFCKIYEIIGTGHIILPYSSPSITCGYKPLIITMVVEINVVIFDDYKNNIKVLKLFSAKQTHPSNFYTFIINKIHKKLEIYIYVGIKPNIKNQTEYKGSNFIHCIKSEQERNRKSNFGLWEKAEHSSVSIPKQEEQKQPKESEWTTLNVKKKQKNRVQPKQDKTWQE